MSKNPRTAPILHRNVTLLVASDPLLLSELQADPRVGPHLKGQLSPEVAFAPPEAGEQLIKHVSKAGHLPKVID
jgi:hypothetical protein